VVVACDEAHAWESGSHHLTGEILLQEAAAEVHFLFRKNNVLFADP
jgi:hypothetical protein